MKQTKKKKEKSHVAKKGLKTVSVDVEMIIQSIGQGYLDLPSVCKFMYRTQVVKSKTLEIAPYISALFIDVRRHLHVIYIELFYQESTAYHVRVCVHK